MGHPRAAGGAAWTVGGYAAMQVLRFGFNVALAQAVAPKLFGVMALTNLLVQGLQMFSDLGLRQCVVQHPRGDDRAFLDTAWTLQVARGAALWLGAAALAWPMAVAYQEPALAWLVPLAGAGAFVAGFQSAAVLGCARHVRRGPLVRREVGAYALTVAAVLTAVHLIARHWPADTRTAALYAAVTGGAVFSAVLELGLSFTLPGAARPRFRLEPAARRQLLSFGGWVFVSTGLTFLAGQADRLVVGRLSLDVLGVYHIAAVIAAVPVALLGAVGTHLGLPLLAAALRAGEPPGPAFRRCQRPLLAAAGLLATGAACVGPAFVELVYDDRYAAAAGFVRRLGLAAWFTMLVAPAELALLAVGRTRGLAAGQAVRLAALAVALPLGYLLDGVPGLVLGVAAGEAVRYLVVSRAAAGHGFDGWRTELAVTAAAGGLAAGYLAAEALLLAGSGPAVRLVVGSAALVSAWAALYRLFAGRPAGGRDGA